MAASYPDLMPLPFADGGAKNTIPLASVTPKASLTDGFPPPTRLPISAGGVPPDGLDFNGILNWITQHNVWASSGGRYYFDAAHAAAIGGYSEGAVLLLDDNSAEVISTVDANTTDPNSSMTGWGFWSGFPLLAESTSGRGAAFIGVRKQVTGGVARTLEEVEYSTMRVKDFGAVGDAYTDDTAAINAALTWLAGANTRHLVFDYGAYCVTQITLTNGFKGRITFNGATLIGAATTAKDSVFKVLCCVSTDFIGTWEIIGSSYYDCGLSIQASVASGGTCSFATDKMTIVTAPTVGAYQVGDLVGAYGVTPGTTILSLFSGVANQVGAVYQLSSTPGVVAAEIMYTTKANACSTRNNIGNLTLRNCRVGIMQGLYNVDAQNSETSYFGCNFFGCPRPFLGGGTQTGATFIGCNLCSEPNAIFTGETCVSAQFEGGFWYVSGGEITQVVATAGFSAIIANPAETSVAAYGCNYPIVKVANAHIESAGLLLYLHNPKSIAGASGAASSIAFTACSGYISSPGLTGVVDTTGDNGYDGKLVFDNACSFYGGAAEPDRSSAHIYLGTNTVLDMEGAPFGRCFKPGLSGVSTSYLGKPRLHGEVILAVHTSTTSIGIAATTVDFSASTGGTVDTVYGQATYSAGVFTTGQALKDVTVNAQLVFASAVPLANAWVDVGGAVKGFLARASDTLLTGSIVIPAVPAGATIAIKAVTNSGGSVALSGAVDNFMHLSART